MSDNSLVLTFSDSSVSSKAKVVQKRNRAVLAFAKLVSTGMGVDEAKDLIQQIWVDAFDEGYACAQEDRCNQDI
jgi:hypothetical protein